MVDICIDTALGGRAQPVPRYVASRNGQQIDGPAMLQFALRERWANHDRYCIARFLVRTARSALFGERAHVRPVRVESADIGLTLEPFAAYLVSHDWSCPGRGVGMARVLVVEDETQVLMLAESVPQEPRHDTLSAATVAEAQAIINDATQKFELLVTDIQLANHAEGGITLGKAAFFAAPS